MEFKPHPDCTRKWDVCNEVTNRFEIRTARFCGTCGGLINGYHPPNALLSGPAAGDGWRSGEDRL